MSGAADRPHSRPYDDESREKYDRIFKPRERSSFECGECGAYTFNTTRLECGICGSKHLLNVQSWPAHE